MQTVNTNARILSARNQREDDEDALVIRYSQVRNATVGGYCVIASAH